MFQTHHCLIGGLDLRLLGAVIGVCAASGAAWALRLSARRAKRKSAFLNAAFEHLSNGVCIFSPEGRIVWFNECYAKLVGLPREALGGALLSDVIARRMRAKGLTRDPTDYVTQLVAEMRNGNVVARYLETMSGATVRIVDQPMRNGGWVSTWEDVTQQREAEAQIVHLAYHDPLTDLANRPSFLERLGRALLSAQPDERIAVLCIDLDNFKAINDTLGHAIGDALLTEVGRRLRQCVREGDCVARMGGDEFAVMQAASNIRTYDASALASRLVEKLREPYRIDGHQVAIGASVGVSIFPVHGRDVEQLMSNADLAMYGAKAGGRNAFRFFEPDMGARAQARRTTEMELRDAIRRNEFVLHYQPILSLERSEVIGFEALARWNHPGRGLLFARDFIPLAEESGLIAPLGEVILEMLCRDAAHWPRHVRAALNISAAEFRTRRMADVVLAALSAGRLPPTRLEVEINERALAQARDSALSALHALREAGVKICMDNFGSGSSSLRALRSFPFDKIKIDRSLVDELTRSRDALAIVRAVAGLGRSLGIATNASGVETEGQLALLRAEGCDEVQGLLFGSPRSSSEVATLAEPCRVQRVVA